MQTITLPGTSLEVSRLAFGCWGIITDFHWGERHAAESVAAMNTAFDAGVTFFDTAEVYANGDSEKLVGETFASRRDKIVLASKVAPDSMTPAGVVEACERSLTRLQTDYLDLYQTHWTDPETPAAETWGAMLKLQEQGKVRHIGVCNMGLGDMNAIAPQAQPVTNQLPYNLVWRAIEAEILPHCRSHNIGVLAYSPLMHGMLADKFQTAADVPDGRARSRHFSTEREKARHGEPGCEEETFAAISAIRNICKELGRSMADVSLAWVAAQPGVTAVIAGVKNETQLNANLQSFDNPLPAAALEQLHNASAKLMETLGPNPDMWQGGGSSRYS